ncbi:acyl-CoA carboxylase subunit epsilon [Nocardioides sp. HM23]|uniref:acyl-CoA carboxylase subunit epsilon n=1 Tax=Nocardioides bizhenqiangii TaxID=3095076 RepID=UPI002ACAAC69|nr:acyl-CoA carboxylase subunit epsilon [Nocardioides sp. HM23]MDZ5621648.1 acyl-CoA carboxylase subunit epsilon [Nocardioides sp. HM23]
MTKDTSPDTPTEPLLRVLTPDATPEEVAAVVAVFAALGGGAPAPEKPRSVWASPARRMRGPHVHGRGAWQASARGIR